MKINYNVTGSERKALVQVIGQAVREKPVYMKMPTCAYAIGDIIVNRNGEMIWDELTDDATIRRVTEALATAGYTTKDVVAEKAKAETETGTENMTETSEEVLQEAAELAEPEPVSITVSLPVARHGGNSLRNLINLVYTRACLINKALGTRFKAEQGLVDALSENEGLRTAEDLRKAVAAYEDKNGKALTGLTITTEKITFSSLPETSDADTIKAFTELAAMMNKQALDQKRIQAKVVKEKNEKYALRIWLTRLGMNGANYKTTRKILMANLTGHCAFRTEEDKERWQQHQAKMRREARASREVDKA